MKKKLISIALIATLTLGLCSCNSMTPQKAGEEAISMIDVIKEDTFESVSFEKLFKGRSIYASTLNYSPSEDQQGDGTYLGSLPDNTAIVYRFTSDDYRWSQDNRRGVVLRSVSINNVKVDPQLDQNFKTEAVTGYWTDTSNIKVTITTDNRDTAETIYQNAQDYFSGVWTEASVEGGTTGNKYHILSKGDKELVKVTDEGDYYLVEITSYKEI